MNIRFLETFVWLARLQSFRLTADKLKTTQASVSNRIASLESHFDTRLFVRTSRSASLTPAGTKLLGMAERVVRLGEELRRELGGLDRGERSLRIGVVDWAVQSWFSLLMIRIDQRFPGLEVEVVSGTTRQLIEMLENDEVDLIVRLDELVAPECENLPLCELELRWVASPKLGLPDRLLTLAELADYPIIGFSRHALPQVSLERMLVSNDEHTVRMHSVGSVALMIQMVVDCLGVAAVPHASVSRELESGELVLLQTEWPTRALTFVASYRAQAADNLVSRVAALVQETAEEFSAPLQAA